MSDHSKWNTIEREKEKIDSIRAKIFTKIGRELAVAIKEGRGPDPGSNSKLKGCVTKAKAANVPNDNIEHVIKKATGDGNDTKYESIVYEGYGPNGVAVTVEALTDNRNRTTADVRHYFGKFGGNLGAGGCVSFLFSQKGVLVIGREGLSEDIVITDCPEAGAADFQVDDGVFEIYTEPDDSSAALSDLEGKGYEFVSAGVEMAPITYTALSGPDPITKMQKLLDNLKDDGGVQNVWHNWKNANDAR